MFELCRASLIDAVVDCAAENPVMRTKSSLNTAPLRIWSCMRANWNWTHYAVLGRRTRVVGAHVHRRPGRA